jgi:hypothetical protein
MERQEIQTIGHNPSDLEKLNVSQQGSEENILNSEDGVFSTFPDSEKNIK